MRFVLNSSLEHMTLVKIVVTLWRQPDISTKLDYYLVEDEWKIMEKRVKEKILQLPLPEIVKKKVIGLVNPIACKIKKWREYHGDTSIINKLWWTPHGTIDEKKTVEMLVNDETVNFEKRYELSCEYCLEKYILTLQSIVLDTDYCEIYYTEDGIEFPLKLLWSYYISGKMDLFQTHIQIFQKHINLSDNTISFLSPYQIAFEQEARNGNKLAVEYFFPKLTFTERKECLVKLAKSILDNSFVYYTYTAKESYTPIVCFLLSQMSEDEQMQVLKDKYYQVLELLLDWPWHSLFIETASLLWDFMSKQNYFRLLQSILCRMFDAYENYDYRKLFRDFWKHSPKDHKSYVVSACVNGQSDLLLEFIMLKDMQSISVLLRSMTPVERNNILFSNSMMDICKDLIFQEEWDTLEFFIEDCILKNEILEFRDNFQTHITCEHDLMINKKLYEKFFCLLDDFVSDSDKKKCTGEGNQGKRFCRNIY